MIFDSYSYADERSESAYEWFAGIASGLFTVDLNDSDFSEEWEAYSQESEMDADFELWLDSIGF